MSTTQSPGHRNRNPLLDRQQNQNYRNQSKLSSDRKALPEPQPRAPKALRRHHERTLPARDVWCNPKKHSRKHFEDPLSGQPHHLACAPTPSTTTARHPMGYEDEYDAVESEEKDGPGRTIPPLDHSCTELKGRHEAVPQHVLDAIVRNTSREKPTVRIDGLEMSPLPEEDQNRIRQQLPPSSYGSPSSSAARNSAAPSPVSPLTNNSKKMNFVTQRTEGGNSCDRASRGSSNHFPANRKMGQSVGCGARASSEEAYFVLDGIIVNARGEVIDSGMYPESCNLDEKELERRYGVDVMKLRPSSKEKVMRSLRAERVASDLRDIMTIEPPSPRKPRAATSHQSDSYGPPVPGVERQSPLRYNASFVHQGDSPSPRYTTRTRVGNMDCGQSCINDIVSYGQERVSLANEEFIAQGSLKLDKGLPLKLSEKIATHVVPGPTHSTTSTPRSDVEVVSASERYSPDASPQQLHFSDRPRHNPTNLPKTSFAAHRRRYKSAKRIPSEDENGQNLQSEEDLSLYSPQTPTDECKRSGFRKSKFPAVLDDDDSPPVLPDEANLYDDILEPKEPRVRADLSSLRFVSRADIPKNTSSTTLRPGAVSMKNALPLDHVPALDDPYVFDDSDPICEEKLVKDLPDL